MEIRQADGKLKPFEIKLEKKVKGPSSERAYWIQQMADLAGVSFTGVLRKTFHFPKGTIGTKMLKSIYEEATMQEGEWQRIRMWSLIKKTK